MTQLDLEKQRQFAIDVVRQLRAAGYEAFWAGGCVRDRLLGRAAKDYDVATSAKPDEIRIVFERRRTLALGAAFGVITVLGPRGAGQIEVTTFRQDATYSDGRHPDHVIFSSAREDALRRDFTINGLYFDPIDERVIDYVEGQQDLARRTVRAIGDARARFAEDKLRMLRAVRFAALLDFEIDPATAAAVSEMVADINIVSPERIAAELRLMLTGPRRRRAVELLSEVGLLEVVLPEVAAARAEAWTLVLSALEHLEEPSLPLVLAALLPTEIDRKDGEAIARRLRLPNREIDRLGWLIENRGALRAAAELPWPRLQPYLVAAGVGDLLALEEAELLARGGDVSGIEYCRRMLALPGDELDPPPLISGDDLVARGLPRGKHYQWLLDRVRDAQLSRQVESKAAALELVDRLWRDRRS